MSDATQSHIKKIRTFADDYARIKGAPKVQHDLATKTIATEVDSLLKTRSAEDGQTAKDQNTKHTAEGTQSNKETLPNAQQKEDAIPEKPITTLGPSSQPVFDQTEDVPRQQTVDKSSAEGVEPKGVAPQTPMDPNLQENLKTAALIKENKPSILTSKSQAFDVDMHEAERGEGTIISDTKRKEWKLFPAIKNALHGWVKDKGAEIQKAKEPKHTIHKPEQRKEIIEKALSKRSQTDIGTEGIKKRVAEKPIDSQTTGELSIKDKALIPKPTWTYVVDEQQKKNVSDAKTTVKPNQQETPPLPHTPPKIEEPPETSPSSSKKTTVSLQQKTPSPTPITPPAKKPDSLLRQELQAKETPEKKEGTFYTSYTSIPSVERNLRHNTTQSPPFLKAKKSELAPRTDLPEEARASVPRDNDTYQQEERTNSERTQPLPDSQIKNAKEPTVHIEQPTERKIFQQPTSGSESTQKTPEQISEPLPLEMHAEEDLQRVTPPLEDDPLETPSDIPQPKVPRAPIPESRLARLGTPREEMPTRTPWMGITFVAGSVCAVLLGIGATLWWFGFFETQEETVAMTIPSLVQSDATTALAFVENREVLLSTIAEEVSSISSGVTEFYFVDGIDNNTLIHAPDVLDVLTFRAPGNFIRTIEAIGFGSQNGAPFIVLHVRSFDVAFSGILSWESAISADLAPLFGEPVRESFDPQARTASQTRTPHFTDDVIENNSIRVLLDEDGVQRIVYGFKNENTMLITTTKDHFREIFPRIR